MIQFKIASTKFLFDLIRLLLVIVETYLSIFPLFIPILAESTFKDSMENDEAFSSRRGGTRMSLLFWLILWDGPSVFIPVAVDVVSGIAITSGGKSVVSIGFVGLNCGVVVVHVLFAFLTTSPVYSSYICVIPS